MFRYLSLTVLASQIAFAAVEVPPLTTVVASPSGKNVLADSQQRTLYIFDIDKGKPTSACNGGCAEIWPPYLLTEAEVKELKAPFTSVKRSSQELQLVYQGMPVYTYAYDRAAGDIIGDGLGKVWHIIEIVK